MRTRQQISIALLLMVMIWTGFGLITGATMIRFAGSDAELLVQEEDVSLEIEDWMTNDFIWNANFDLLSDAGNVIGDEDLKIAAWMTDDELWRF